MELEPAGHASHMTEPKVGLYVDALHAVHCVPLDPVYPGIHSQRLKVNANSLVVFVNSGQLEQLSTEIAFVIEEYLAKGHDLQFMATEVSWYLPLVQEKQLLLLPEPTLAFQNPGLHAVHGPPFGPANPVLH